MEISVGFADNRTDLDEYVEDQSNYGKVYIPRQGVEIKGPIRIRYEKHPWIEQFEVDGIKPSPPKRTGIGTKRFESFVQSLGTIYSVAFEDFGKFHNPKDYFGHVTRRWMEEYSDEEHERIFKKFCGYVENLWREGDQEMYDVCMDTVIPMLRSDERIWEIFTNTITDEFKGVQNGKKEEF